MDSDITTSDPRTLSEIFAESGIPQIPLRDPNIPDSEEFDYDYDYNHDGDYESSDYDSWDDEMSDAQEQWEHSLQAFENLFSMVLLPCVGKLIGKRTAYFLWGLYLQKTSNYEVVVDNPVDFGVSEAVQALV